MASYHYTMSMRTIFGTAVIALGAVDSYLNVVTPQSLPLLHLSVAEPSIVKIPELRTGAACPAIGVSFQGFPFDNAHYGICGTDYASLAFTINWAIATTLVVCGGLALLYGILLKRP
jgi:hypothetical protein